MTLNDVKTRLFKINETRGDNEVAHTMEDELHQDVLRAIADGTCDDPKACAAEALKSIDIDFARWYA